MDHIDNLSEALRHLSSGVDPLTLTLAKSTNTLSIGPLSSSSSGHNMHVEDHVAAHQHQAMVSPKAMSTSTSPIKVRAGMVTAVKEAFVNLLSTFTRTQFEDPKSLPRGFSLEALVEVSTLPDWPLARPVKRSTMSTRAPRAAPRAS